MERIGFGKLAGWELFESLMERIVERGDCSEALYTRHLNGEDGSERTMDSFEFFLKWKREHPGQTVPRPVRMIRNDEQHRFWVEQGMPRVEDGRIRCKRCRADHAPHQGRDLRVLGLEQG